MSKKLTYAYQDIFVEYRNRVFTEDIKAFVKSVYHVHFSKDKIFKEKLKKGYHTVYSVQGNGRFRNYGVGEGNLFKTLSTRNSIHNLSFLFKKENSLGSPLYGKSQVVINTDSLVKILEEK